jgi:glycosyltransferase involved in cell wall biosynthesis
VKPCLLIPHFEHADPLKGVVDALAVHGLPCIVVDDGSSEATVAVLRELAERHPWLRIHLRGRNGGRGAALKTGYRIAFEEGFTHAIQLDADGQHDPADVPRFLDAIAEAPEALVLGAPVFDQSVPAGRLYGRQLSRVMVWATTLSFDVTDPLCGFRGIPLAATVRLLDATATGDHMEFDPELVIRLHWQGVEVRNVPTHVVYDPEGTSHFDMLRDNVRMTRTYARAVVESLFRVPARVLRRRGP